MFTFTLLYLCVDVQITIVEVRKLCTDVFLYLQLFIPLHLRWKSLDALCFLGLAGGRGGASLGLFLCLLGQWNLPSLGQHRQPYNKPHAQRTYTLRQLNLSTGRNWWIIHILLHLKKQWSWTNWKCTSLKRLSSWWYVKHARLYLDLIPTSRREPLTAFWFLQRRP